VAKLAEPAIIKVMAKGMNETPSSWLTTWARGNISATAALFVTSSVSSEVTA
jgi:hypothetical protein